MHADDVVPATDIDGPVGRRRDIRNGRIERRSLDVDHDPSTALSSEQVVSLS